MTDELTESGNMRSVGRLMQFAGLSLLPVAMFLELGNAFSLGKMLIMAIFGLSCFWLGRIIEGYSPPAT